MGWCHEFGCQIVYDCDHPMTAGAEACTCTVCEVVCTGRFGGCADVWARGPQPVHIVDLAPKAASAEEVREPVMEQAPVPEEASGAAPEPARDPATEVLLWLRGEFDYVNGQIQALSDRLARQEAAVRSVADTRQEELAVSLAELEGCAAQLRNEASSLRDMRATLAEALPQLIAEAAGPAVTRTVDGAVAGAVAEVRAAVAELGGALAEVLPSAVAQAVVPPPAAPAAIEASEEAVGAADPLTQLHEAQDEAAEWFTIVVDEAIRRAVERYLPPAGGQPASPAPPSGSAGPPGTGMPPLPAPVAGTPMGVADDTPSAELGGAPPSATPSAPTLTSTPTPAPGNGEAAEGSAEGEGGGAASSASTGAAVATNGPQEPVPVPVAPLTADVTLTSPAPLLGDPAPSLPTAAAHDAAPARPVEEPPAAASWDEQDEEPDRQSTVACVLPGVAVGPTLALGVSSALRRARLRRRRRRPAGAPIAGLYRRDPFAGDVSRGLDRFALTRRDLAFTANGTGPAHTRRVVVVVAEHDDREVGIDLAAVPIAVVGPGAADAGRAIVTTLLAQVDPSSAHVVAVGDVLPPGPSFPGLERIDDLTAALDRLEVELDRRSRLPSDPEPGANGRNGDGGGLPAGAEGDAARAEGDAARAEGDAARAEGDAARAEGDTAPGDGLAPLLVLAATGVPEALADRVSGLLERGRALGLSALGVGCQLEGAVTVTLQPGAVVRTVTPGGQLDGLVGARLFTLSPGATLELLHLLWAARTDEEGAPADPQDEPFPVLVAPEPPPIRVRLLGAYRIEVGGNEIRSGLRAKARELLAFYLLHPEGTTLDAATEALWPEADPGRGSEWFWTALGNLRTTLRRATGTKELRIIERDGDRYRIEPVFDVDLWNFQAALPPAPGANPNDPEWAAALQTAADLYAGELLADVDWAWAEVPRDDLRRRAVDVLVSLAATRLVGGADVRSALDALSRAVEVDPVAEQLYRRIMRLHARQSRPDEVAATFRRLKARLGELDLEPTPESEQLVAELCG